MFSINKRKILSNTYSVGMGRDIITAKSRTSMTASGVSTNSYNLGTNFQTEMLEGFVDDASEEVIRNLYNEIYYYDGVSGPAADIKSTLPWSSYSLMGTTDQSILDSCNQCLQELDIENLMKKLSVNYLIQGITVGSLIFNQQRGIFSDLILHDINSLDITPIPLVGYDPKIDLKVTPEFKKFLRSADERDKEAFKEISPELVTKMLKGTKVPLEPISTLFLCKTYIPNSPYMSYFTRILPIWLIEKALMRGTIIGAWKRQRSILHVTAGNEEWEPTDEQLEAITQLFISADQDPQGAVVVTRQGISSEEVRDGANFWKVSDESDIFANAKMRALGMNEGLLSGDSSYNNTEQAITILLEDLLNFREQMTGDVIYNKIFLTLAKYHGWKERTQAELKHNIRLDSKSGKTKTNIYSYKNIAYAGEYIIPTINWHKELSNDADDTYFERLGALEEKGVPIPISMYAAAAGVNIDDVVESMEHDINVRTKLKKFKDSLKLKGLTGGGVDEDEDEDMLSGILAKSKLKNGDKKFIKSAPKEMVLSSKVAESITKTVHGINN